METNGKCWSIWLSIKTIWNEKLNGTIYVESAHSPKYRISIEFVYNTCHKSINPTHICTCTMSPFAIFKMYPIKRMKKKHREVKAIATTKNLLIFSLCWELDTFSSLAAIRLSLTCALFLILTHCLSAKLRKKHILYKAKL